jgi:hypothetical protein
MKGFIIRVILGVVIRFVVCFYLLAVAFHAGYKRIRGGSGVEKVGNRV